MKKFFICFGLLCATCLGLAVAAILVDPSKALSDKLWSACGVLTVPVFILFVMTPAILDELDD